MGRFSHLGLWALLAGGLLVLAAFGVAADARVRVIALNSLLLAAGTCAIALPIGTLLAWVLVRSDLPERRWLLSLVLLLLFVPLYLVAAGWQSAGGRQGMLSPLFLEQGPTAVAPGELPAVRPPLLDGWTGAIWVHAMAAIPWVVLIVGLGLSQVEPELEEQALLDGSPTMVAWRVTLPRAMPSVIVAALWIFVTVASEMTITDLFQVRTFAEEIYLGYARNPIDNVLDDTPLAILPGVAAVAWIAVAAAICALHLSPLARERSPARLKSFELGAAVWPVRGLLAAVLLVVVGVPLASLFFKAGIGVEQVAGEPVRTWSAGKAVRMIAGSFVEETAHGRWSLALSIRWTLILGVVAASVTVVIAGLLAWWARLQTAGAIVVTLLAAFLFAIPGPLVGLAIIHAFQPWDWGPIAWLYDDTIFAPTLALVLRALPICTLLLWHTLRSVDDDQLGAAAVDGAGVSARFWRIVLPQRSASFTVAWIVAFLLATGDVSYSYLVRLPSTFTVPWDVFTQLHAGVEDRMAGLGLAWTLICLLLGGLAQYLWKIGTADGSETRSPAKPLS